MKSQLTQRRTKLSIFLSCTVFTLHRRGQIWCSWSDNGGIKLLQLVSLHAELHYILQFHLIRTVHHVLIILEQWLHVDVMHNAVYIIHFNHPFGCLQTFQHTYLKLRVSARSVADSMHAVVSLRSLGQRQVTLVDIFAPSQRNITHQQQPGAVCHAGLGVLQTGAVEMRTKDESALFNICEKRWIKL